MANEECVWKMGYKGESCLKHMIFEKGMNKAKVTEVTIMARYIVDLRFSSPLKLCLKDGHSDRSYSLVVTPISYQLFQ